MSSWCSMFRKLFPSPSSMLYVILLKSSVNCLYFQLCLCQCLLFLKKIYILLLSNQQISFFLSARKHYFQTWWREIDHTKTNSSRLSDIILITFVMHFLLRNYLTSIYPLCCKRKASVFFQRFNTILHNYYSHIRRGPLSLRHGSSSGCGWRRRSPVMEGSYEYME
jgi:hypothetical protein